MKKYFTCIAFALLLLCSCDKEGTPVEVTGNLENFKPVFLFEWDGVKVYRFVDGGRNIYFTNTSGRVDYSYTQYTHATKTRTTYHVETICVENPKPQRKALDTARLREISRQAAIETNNYFKNKNPELWP